MTFEVKFRITDPGIFWSLQTIDQLNPYSLSEPQFEKFDDVYLDTKKRRILLAGYCCRQRNQAKGFLISLIKLGSKERGGQKPKKWDVLLKKNKNSPADWPESRVRKKVLEIIPDKKLQPIFRAHQTRITRLIHNSDQLIAHAILDDMSLITTGKEPHFKTLKIKMLIPGGENHFEAITARLQSKWSLEPEPLTIFEQIIALEGK